jgi:hypothetical protein
MIIATIVLIFVETFSAVPPSGGMVYFVPPKLPIINNTMGLSCIPVPKFPTPTLRWNHDMVNTIGYRVYYRGNGEPWTLCADLKIWYDRLDDGTIDPEGSQYRYGRDLDFPIQRCQNRKLELLEWTVTAYNNIGESTFVTPVRICEPIVWPGAPSPYN